MRGLAPGSSQQIVAFIASHSILPSYSFPRVLHGMHVQHGPGTSKKFKRLLPFLTPTRPRKHSRQEHEAAQGQEGDGGSSDLQWGMCAQCESQLRPSAMPPSPCIEPQRAGRSIAPDRSTVPAKARLRCCCCCCCCCCTLTMTLGSRAAWVLTTVARAAKPWIWGKGMRTSAPAA